MELLRVVSEPVPRFSSSAVSETSSSRESPSAVVDSSENLTITEVVTSVRRRPIPRKGHTKSRRGCLNCKRRKVKCQETLPECNHCKRIGLKCEYPPERPRPAVFWLASSSPSAALQSMPTTATFTMDDMRFFQHFLLKAYPPLPIHGGGIWREVAQISHGFDYLVHSMLGLAASSLAHSLALTAAASPASYEPAAISHRVTAIRLLNDSLSRPCSCPEEGTARYAAMMALTFQSSYMADGMLEFVSMTRGCHVVAHAAMGGAYSVSPFGVFSREGHVDACRRLGPKPAWEVDQQADEVLTEEVAEGLLDGLRTLATLCGGRSKLEDEVLAKVEQVVALARWDCIEAFDEVTLVYALLGEADHDDFFAFVDSANFPAQILLVYFFLVEYTVAYHAMGFIRSSFAHRTATTKLWIGNLAARLPKEYEPYMEWPVKFAESLSLDLFTT
ncbi:hypothetical protein CONLIGDRAFT_73856 [Coniochaeta ligniaria NRRL 30616]|uniref:Zn(2)-C6 fungal-type domain-containing protein n=1 Tax=Coniochaeta ligniaria NRRL 30616 TaxID=1408157 RepID=A0A1J7IC53_9PEZI|nr:hypothetical protein CONLIGDRAFT_73856 [Coniochaeta ligniaria NRRL 30616]